MDEKQMVNTGKTNYPKYDLMKTDLLHMQSLTMLKEIFKILTIFSCAESTYYGSKSLCRDSSSEARSRYSCVALVNEQVCKSP